MKRILLEQLAAKGVWLACVMGAASGAPWIGSTTALAWIFLRLRAAPARRRTITLVLAAGAIGLLADAVLIGLGGLRYPGNDPDSWLGPLWITTLWMAYSLVVYSGLGWLHGRPWITAALGAVGGSLAYRAGAQLEAVSFDVTSHLVWLVIALVWGAALPLLLRVAVWAEPANEAGRAHATSARPKLA